MTYDKQTFYDNLWLYWYGHCKTYNTLSSTVISDYVDPLFLTLRVLRVL